MTTAVYVTSTQTYSGKSALCLGLMKRFRADGFSSGYMKPLSTTAHVTQEGVFDEDALFMKKTFDLADDHSLMSPVVLDNAAIARLLKGQEGELTGKVLSAFQKVSQGRDIVVLEGGACLREGWWLNLAPHQVTELIHAREIIVVPYMNDLQVVDDILAARGILGETLLGAVVNLVPAHRAEFLKSQVKPFVEHRGVPIFATIPKSRLLFSASVAELNDGLQGEVLCAPQALNELVENLVVGAMGADMALAYLRQRPNQAVITGGDRADIQLAALETSTRCLILTGNIQPNPRILARAAVLGVPILLTKHDTMTAIGRIKVYFGRARFQQPEKIAFFEGLFKEHMDFERLYEVLGLGPPARTS